MDGSSSSLQYGSKKRVKIHPDTVTVKYATHFPQPGDEGYDDAPSFEDFGAFAEANVGKRLVSDSKGGRTFFGTMETQPKRVCWDSLLLSLPLRSSFFEAMSYSPQHSSLSRSLSLFPPSLSHSVFILWDV